jgi:hypothetical protein
VTPIQKHGTRFHKLPKQKKAALEKPLFSPILAMWVHGTAEDRDARANQQRPFFL